MAKNIDIEAKALDTAILNPGFEFVKKKLNGKSYPESNVNAIGIKPVSIAKLAPLSPVVKQKGGKDMFTLEQNKKPIVEPLASKEEIDYVNDYYAKNPDNNPITARPLLPVIQPKQKATFDWYKDSNKNRYKPVKSYISDTKEFLSSSSSAYPTHDKDWTKSPPDPEIDKIISKLKLKWDPIDKSVEIGDVKGTKRELTDNIVNRIEKYALANPEELQEMLKDAGLYDDSNIYQEQFLINDKYRYEKPWLFSNFSLSKLVNWLSFEPKSKYAPEVTKLIENYHKKMELLDGLQEQKYWYGNKVKVNEHKFERVQREYLQAIGSGFGLDVIENITGMDTGLSTMFLSDPVKVMDKTIKWLTNKSKFHHSPPSQREVLDKITGILAIKAQIGEEEARKGFEGVIDGSNTTEWWIRSTGEAIAFLFADMSKYGMWGRSARGFEKLYRYTRQNERLAKLLYTVDKVEESPKYVKFVESASFKNRLKFMKAAIAGKPLEYMGIKVPELAKIMGEPARNVVRATTASFMSQLLNHTDDEEYAIKGAEHMFLLESMNQVIGNLSRNLGMTYKFASRAFRSLAKHPEAFQNAVTRTNNTFYTLGLFPAVYSTSVFNNIIEGKPNPIALDGQMLSDLAIALTLSGHTLKTNRRLVKDFNEINDYYNNIAEKQKTLVGDPYRKRIKLSEDWTEEQVLRQYANSDIVSKDVVTEYNAKKDALERNEYLTIDYSPNLHGYLKDKVKKSEVNISDMLKIHEKIAPEDNDVKRIVEKLNNTVGNIKVVPSKTTEVAIYSDIDKNVHLNDTQKKYNTEKNLLSIGIHEGLHGIVVPKLNTDASFDNEITDAHKKLNDTFTEYPELIDKAPARIQDLLHEILGSKEEMVSYLLDYSNKDLQRYIKDLDNNIIEIIENREYQKKNWYQKFLYKISKAFDFVGSKSEKERQYNEFAKSLENVLDKYIIEETSASAIAGEEALKTENVEPRLEHEISPAAIESKEIGTESKRLSENNVEELLSGLALSIENENTLNDEFKAGQLAKDSFYSKLGFSSQEKFIRETKDMNLEQVKQLLHSRFKNHFEKVPEPLLKMVSTYFAERAKNTETFSPLHIRLRKVEGKWKIDKENNDYPSLGKLTGTRNSKGNRVDKTKGKETYFRNYTTVNKKNNDESPYRNKYSNWLSDKLTLANTTKIADVLAINERYSEKYNKLEDEHVVSEEISNQLLHEGYYMIPQGSSGYNLLRIPGLEKLMAKRDECTKFAHNIMFNSFWKWIDSDATWNYEKKRYSSMSDGIIPKIVDEIKMFEKYVEGNAKIKFNDIVKDDKWNSIKSQDRVAYRAIIDEIGTKMNSYFRNAHNETYIPLSLRKYNNDIRLIDYANNGEEILKGTNREIVYDRMVKNAITDYLSWIVDGSGKSRFISFNEANEIEQSKNQWKYINIPFTTEKNRIDNVESLQDFIPEKLYNEEGDIDINTLSKYSLVTDTKGDVLIKNIVIDPESFKSDPILYKILSKAATDGATFVTNNNLHGLLCNLLLADINEASVTKPKYYKADDNGNVTILKTANFRNLLDNHTKEHNPVLYNFLKKYENATGLITFKTASKGEGTFRVKEVIENDLNYILDNDNQLLRVEKKSGGEWKYDAELTQKEIAKYGQDLIDGNVNPRYFKNYELTGNNALTMLMTSHATKRSSSSAFGIDKIPMFMPYYPIFLSEEGKACWNSLMNFKNNVVNDYIKESYGDLLALPYIYNSIIDAKEKTFLKKDYTIDKNILKRAGQGLKKIADHIDYLIELDTESDSNKYGYQFAFELKEVRDILNSCLDKNANLKEESVFKALIVGDIVAGRKNKAPGENTLLFYTMRRLMQDAEKLRSRGASMTLVPDIQSRADMYRAAEYRIAKGEDPEFVRRHTKELEQEVIDPETGVYKAYGKGCTLGIDIVERLGLKIGDRIFVKITPVDDLHSMVPMILTGISHNKGTVSINTEYATDILSRDFDKDNMSILVSNRHIKATNKQQKGDYDIIWEYFDKIGIGKGIFKNYSNEMKKLDKKLIGNDHYAIKDVLGVSKIDPTTLPQHGGFYDKTQQAHTNVGTKLSHRNKLTLAFQNFDWQLFDDGIYRTTIKLPKGEEAVLKYDPNYVTENGITHHKMSSHVNFALNKFVDPFDFTAFDPLEVLYMTFVDSYKGIKNESGKLNKDVQDIIKDLSAVFNKASGNVIKDLGRGDNFSTMLNAITKANTHLVNYERNSVTAAITESLNNIREEGITIPGKNSNGAEVMRYIVTQNLSNHIIEQVQTQLHDKLRENSAYLGEAGDIKGYDWFFSNKFNENTLPNWFGLMFSDFNKYYGKTFYETKSGKKRDLFSFMSNKDFKGMVIGNSEGHEWRRTLCGTILNNWFNRNPHEIYKKKVKLQNEDISVETIDNEIILSNDAGNSIKLRDLFDEKGELQADWISPELLQSYKLRNLVKPNKEYDQVEKIDLISKAAVNVADRILKTLNDGTEFAKIDKGLLTTAILLTPFKTEKSYHPLIPNAYTPSDIGHVGIGATGSVGLPKISIKASEHYDIKNSKDIRYLGDELEQKSAVPNDLKTHQDHIQKQVEGFVSRNGFSNWLGLSENKERVKEIVANEVHYDIFELIDGVRKTGVEPLIDQNLETGAKITLKDYIFGKIEELGIENRKSDYQETPLILEKELLGKDGYEINKSAVETLTIRPLDKDSYKKYFNYDSPKSFILGLGKYIDNEILEGNLSDRSLLKDVYNKPLSYLSKEQYRELHDNVLQPAIDNAIRDIAKQRGLTDAEASIMVEGLVKQTSPQAMSIIRNIMLKDGDNNEMVEKASHLLSGVYIVQLAKTLKENASKRSDAKWQQYHPLKTWIGKEMLKNLSNNVRYYFPTTRIAVKTDLFNGLGKTEEGKIEDTDKTFVHLYDEVDLATDVQMFVGSLPKQYVELILPVRHMNSLRNVLQGKLQEAVDHGHIVGEKENKNNINIEKLKIINDDVLFARYIDSYLKNDIEGEYFPIRDNWEVTVTKEGITNVLFHAEKQTFDFYQEGQFKRAAEILANKYISGTDIGTIKQIKKAVEVLANKYSETDIETINQIKKATKILANRYSGTDIKAIKQIKEAIEILADKYSGTDIEVVNQIKRLTELIRQDKKGNVRKADIEAMKQRASEYVPVIEYFLKLKAMALQSANIMRTEQLNLEQWTWDRIKNEDNKILCNYSKKYLNDYANKLINSDASYLLRMTRNANMTDAEKLDWIENNLINVKVRLLKQQTNPYEKGEIVDKSELEFGDIKKEFGQKYQNIFAIRKEGYVERTSPEQKAETPFGKAGNVINLAKSSSPVPAGWGAYDAAIREVQKQDQFIINDPNVIKAVRDYLNNNEYIWYKGDPETKQQPTTENVLPLEQRQMLTDSLVSDVMTMINERYAVTGVYYNLAHNMKLPGFSKPWHQLDGNAARRGSSIAFQLVRSEAQKLRNDLTGESNVSDTIWQTDSNALEYSQVYNRAKNAWDLANVMLQVNPELLNETRPNSAGEAIPYFIYSYKNFQDNINAITNDVARSISDVARSEFEAYGDSNKLAHDITINELTKPLAGDIIYSNFHSPTLLSNELNKSGKRYMFFVDPGTQLFIRYKSGLGEIKMVSGRFLGLWNRRNEVYEPENKGGEYKETLLQPTLEFFDDVAQIPYRIDMRNIVELSSGEPYGTLNRYQDKYLRKEYYRIADEYMIHVIGKANLKTKVTEYQKGDEIKASYEVLDKGSNTYDLFKTGLEKIDWQADKSVSKFLAKMMGNADQFYTSYYYLGGRHLAKLSAHFTLLGTSQFAGIGGDPRTHVDGIIQALGGYGGRLEKGYLGNVYGFITHLLRRPIYPNLEKADSKIKWFLGLPIISPIHQSFDMIITDKKKVSATNVGAEKIQQLKATNATEIQDYMENLSKRTLLDTFKEAKVNSKYANVLSNVVAKISEIESEFQSDRDHVAKQLKNIISRYKADGTEIDLVKIDDKIVPLINRRSLKEYKTDEISYLSLMSQALSMNNRWAGFEIKSVERVVVAAESQLTKFQKEYRAHPKFTEGISLRSALASSWIDNFIWKSIGNYEKTFGQNSYIGRLMQKYGKYGHEKTLDQTTYFIKRLELYRALISDMKKDKGFNKFTSTLGLPFGELFLSDPKKELINQAIPLGISTLAKGWGVYLTSKLGGSLLASLMTSRTGDNLYELATGIFGMGFVYPRILLAIIPPIFDLLYTEDKQKIESIWGGDPKRISITSQEAGIRHNVQSFGNLASEFSGWLTTEAIGSATALSYLTAYKLYHDKKKDVDLSKLSKEEIEDLLVEEIVKGMAIGNYVAGIVGTIGETGYKAEKEKEKKENKKYRKRVQLRRD